MSHLQPRGKFKLHITLDQYKAAYKKFRAKGFTGKEARTAILKHFKIAHWR